MGRTGSGKSSLTLALLRCIYTEGTVYYDGVPTHAINLDALRSNVTIIPQVVRPSFPSFTSPFLLLCVIRMLTSALDRRGDSPSSSRARSARTWTCSVSTTTRR